MSERTTGVYLEMPASHWLKALKDRDPLVRRLAAYALGEIGSLAKEKAILSLTVALKDDKSFVRVWAAAALFRVDPDNRTAISALIAGMKDELSYVRSLAVWHLGRLVPGTPGAKEVLLELQELLGDRDASVRMEASGALKRLRSRSQSHLG